MKKGDLLTYADIIESIGVSLTIYTGKGIENVHNRIAVNQVKYKGDGLWQVTSVDKPEDNPDLGPDPVLHSYKPAKRQ